MNQADWLRKRFRHGKRLGCAPEIGGFVAVVLALGWMAGLVGCVNAAPTGVVADSAATGDSAAPCDPPADGLLPAGSWRSDAAGAFTIDQAGGLLYYSCYNTAWVARAEVVNGGVDWAITWGQTNDTGGGGEPLKGRVTGTFCSSTATLVWTPLFPEATPYERVDADAMPDWCS